MAGTAVFRIVVSSDSIKNATATSHGKSLLLAAEGEPVVEGGLGEDRVDIALHGVRWPHLKRTFAAAFMMTQKGRDVHKNAAAIRKKSLTASGPSVQSGSTRQPLSRVDWRPGGTLFAIWAANTTSGGIVCVVLWLR